MRAREFTSSEQAEFSLNSNVSHVTKSAIIYTQEFKAHAVAQYNQGMPPRKIFEEAGIDLSLFPSDYARYTVKRWRKSSQSVPKSSGFARGHPKNPSNMTVVEMEARIAYLEAENDFLKKLRALEESE